jgi:hypothetical protein
VHNPADAGVVADRDSAIPPLPAAGSGE